MMMMKQRCWLGTICRAMEMMNKTYEHGKVVIYNYVYVGFNSVSNLIVILFNHFSVFL